MPIAKIPVYSDPTDSIYVQIEEDFEGLISTFSTRKYVELNSEIAVEEQRLSIGINDPISLDDELGIDPYLFHFFLNFIEIDSAVDIEVSQNFTEQLLAFIEEEPVDPGDSTGRIENFEQDFAISTIYPEYFKEFHYNGDTLGGYTIYTNSGKGTPLFSVEFVYSSGTLIEKNITRNSDGRVLTITYQYSGETLIGLMRTIS